MTRAFRVSIFTVLFISAQLLTCAGEQNSGRKVVLDSGLDPDLLTYQFVEIDRTDRGFQSEFVPVDLDGDGRLEGYEIQNNWRRRDTLSSIVFYKDPTTVGSVSGQVNRKTLGYDWYAAIDLDGGGGKEILATYVSKDTLWLDIVKPFADSTITCFVATGRDRDGNGFWDGCGYVTTTGDFNGDGVDDILLSCDTGYDKKPRSLICLDWTSNRILWEFEIAGIITYGNVYVLEDSNPAPTVIVGIGSKGNSVSVRDMDDQHTYLIGLNQYGELLWQRTMGVAMTSCSPVVLEDSLGNQRILAQYTSRVSHDPSDQRVVRGLIVLTADGEVVDSLDMGIGERIRSVKLAALSSGEQLVMVHAGQGLQAYSPVLEIQWELEYEAGITFRTAGPVIDKDGGQIIVSTSDRRTWILDEDLKPLARLERAGRVRLIDGQAPESRSRIVVYDGESTFQYTIKKTPWTVVFSRYPILAFLAAFGPLSLVIGIIWIVMRRFREKNRLISQQRDRLDDALTKLKEAQEQLVIAEKYKQAKEIAGGFAHEIRNALFPARTWLSKLKARVDSKGPVEPANLTQYMTDIEDAIDRAVSLTDMVLKYTRLESEVTDASTDFTRQLSKTITTNRDRIEAMGIEVITDCHDDAVVNLTEQHLFIVLNNLLMNSLDALTNTKNGLISICCHRQGELLVVQFQDNGSGIQNADRARIFDAFFTTKPNSGTGIGLAMARRIVQMYGGDIQLNDDRKNTNMILKLRLAGSTGA